MSTNDSTKKTAPKKSTPKAKPAEEETTKAQVAEEEAARKAAEEAAAAADVDVEEVDAVPVDDDDEDDDPLDVLVPMVEPRSWTIGKPPEHGGTDDHYSVYVQRPLGYIQRMEFFAYVSRIVAEAIKAGGSVQMNGNDLLAGEGSVRERAAALVESDFGDVASFVALAMQLLGYADDFLLECYCYWLDVPKLEKDWARKVMRQRWDPENRKWGLTDEQGEEMIAIFIDQNYKDIRRFFVETLPKLGKRVQQQERLLSKKASSKTKSEDPGSAPAQ